MEKKAEIIGSDQSANTLHEPHLKLPLPNEVHHMSADQRETLLALVTQVVSAVLAMVFRKR